jgi:hypothetical protein
LGIIKYKDTPPDLLFLAQIDPECISIICLHIASPKPVPPALVFVLLLRSNGSKTFTISSSVGSKAGALTL